MIEKLKNISLDMNGKPSAVFNKINELVDVVNKQQDIIRQIGEWGSSKGECLWCETLTEFNPEKPLKETFVSVDEALEMSKQDPYAEQRKWIGKACWFWDEKEEKKVFGILTTIDNDCGLSDMCPYWNDTTKNWFEHCEPVSPDDDIIYKKEQQ